MDEVEEMLPEALEHASALDIFVESIAFGLETSTGWVSSRPPRASPSALTSSSSSTMRSVPVALEHNARSVDHLSRIHPDDIGPLARAQCAAVLLPGAEVMGAEACAPARDLIDAGAIVVLATDGNPGHLADLLAAADRRPRRPPLRPQHARGAARDHAQRRVGPGPLRRPRIDRARQASRPRAARLPGEHIAYRLGRNPVAATFVGGEPAYVRPDAAWRISER